jgi:predicted metalloprotease with PDZ domain
MSRFADAPIHYRIDPSDPHGHRFTVTLTVQEPDPAGQTLALPAWIPGSYMIREFARHLLDIEACDSRGSVRLTPLDKHSWRAEKTRGALQVRYTVYAWDLSVRTAHLDATHGFINFTSLCLCVLGQQHRPCTLELVAPPESIARHWKVATSLPRHGAHAQGFGRYRAADYDELIDHPVEMGEFALGRFDAAGARHEIAITGRTDVDMRRLTTDLARICETQARLFEPDTGRAPFSRYVFLTMAVGEAYGGLEHRNSTALLCQRNDLPHPGLKTPSDGYKTFLGLASHEYFHAWHVKRIKPAAFVPYDLWKETHTRLLWIFEGFTSYYDDLMLVRSGVITPEDYLTLLARTMSQVLRGPGRLRQSVAESSFDAWTKYYRQDENSPNSIVSYYAKGALVALAIDLELRARTHGQRSLDDVMRLMWVRLGRDFFTAAGGPGVQRGLEEDGFAGLLQEATGQDLRRELRSWVDGTADLPLARLLAPLGIDLTLSAPDAAPSLGVRWTASGTELRIATALTDGAAHRAGLSAGDALVAIDGLRISSEPALKALLSRKRPGERIEIHVFRRDELLRSELRLQAPAHTEARLSVSERPAAKSGAAARLRQGWLAATHPERGASRASDAPPAPPQDANSLASA